MRNLKRKFCLALAASAGLLVLASCGGGSGGGGNNPGGGGGGPVNNTQALQVNLGPANNLVNGLFVEVTVCAPGTTNCQTIPNIQVDTGSEGLRVLSSQLTLSLPAVTDNGSNALQECVSFADGSYAWGPVVTADIQMAGEKASGTSVQVIAANPAFPVPSACASGGGVNNNTVANLGANGLLGLGVFQQDCGPACAPSSTSVPQLYYLCPNGVCSVATVSLAAQLQNPVWLFPQDNNGLSITLPSLPADGAQTASGTLTFGIGTQTNNALGQALVYTTDNNGNFQTTYNSVAYRSSYIDSGSNGLFFLSSSLVGMPGCPTNAAFYCPASTVNFTATNTGLNGTNAPVNFSIANAEHLFSVNNSSNAAFNDLGGDNPSGFDWGMPFFYGRTVFVGIENRNGPGGIVGPYWAY